MNGNFPAHAGSNSTLLPTRGNSARNVMTQIFSLSALENSQLPTIVFGGAGGATGSVTRGSGACAASGTANAINRASAKVMKRIIRLKYHARFFGGQGVSGTGVKSGLP